MSRLILAESGMSRVSPAELYMNVPTPSGEIIKVREDYFDSLSPEDWHNVMDLIEPYNTMPSVNGLFSKWRENRAQRKDERNERQINKINARAEGRANVAKSGGGVGGALQKVGDFVKGVIGGGAQGAADSMPQTRGVNVDFGYDSTQTKWYQNPWVIGGGVAGLALLVWLVSKSKK